MLSTSESICGSGSFAVQFGDHFRSGIICRRGSFAVLYRGSKIHFSNPASRHYFSSHPTIPPQQTFASRSRLVKPKLLYFTVLRREAKTCLRHVKRRLTKKKKTVQFSSVCLLVRQKRLHLRKVELNRHSFSDHVLIIGYVC